MSNLSGVIPYLVSPIKSNGEVDDQVLGRLCDDLIDKGVSGLTPLGSSGEYAYLTARQKRRIVEVVVEASGRRVPVIPGVASTSTDDAIDQAKTYKQLGADGIVCVLDSYFPLNKSEVQGYFIDIANSVDVPIIVYTNPNYQRTDLDIDTICKLSDHSNIVGLKDASSNTGRLLSILNRCEGKLDVFAASSHIAVAVVMIGGKGVFAGPASVLPEQSVALYNACRHADWSSAVEIQKKLWVFNEVFAQFRLASCLKSALQLQGYPVGDPILPQTPLSIEEIEVVDRALRAASLTI